MPSFTDNYTDKWPSSRPLAPETITKGLKVLKEFTTDLTTQAGQGEEKAKKTTHLYTAGSFIGGMVVIIIIIVMATFGVTDILLLLTIVAWKILETPQLTYLSV